MLITLMIAGCAPDSLPTPFAAGEGFFDHPWPSDQRTIDGHPDLSDFPYQDEFALLAGFLQVGEELDGFGTNSPVYVRLDRPLDTTLLPTPAESQSVDSPLLLLNIDPSSPRRGERVPVQWDFQETQTTWQPENLLAVQPVWGFPLEPATTYALVLSTDIATAPEGFSEVWQLDHADHDYYQPLAETLFQIRRDLEDVAFATIFTTQDPLWDIARITESIQGQLSMPPLDQDLGEGENGGYFTRYTGEIEVPMWQHGVKPYSTEGGGFVFDDDDQPVLYSWDRTAFTLTIPKGEQPAGGWPLVIYSHGTGGDNTTFATGYGNIPAAIFAQAGLAGFGISQPLHGDRGTGADPSLYSFNYINPEAGRTMFRQGALDQIFLAELLTAAQHTFTTSSGEVSLDPDRVAFLGHSQGGEVGAKAAPFFGDRIKGVVLSGTGGGLSITLVERDSDDFDIESLITNALGFSADEELTTFHPTVALVQMTAEATDPINYAPYWHRLEASWSTAPVSVLQTEGLLDVYTPPSSTEALAGASATPIFAPVAQLSTAQELTGLLDEPTPASGNLLAWDGTSVSGGLAQYPDEGHFAIFNQWEAMELYQQFLSSSLTDSLPEVPPFEP